MDALTLKTSKSSGIIYPIRGGLLNQLNLYDAITRSTEAILWPGPQLESNDQAPPAGSGWPGSGLPILFPFAGRTYHDNLPLHYEWSGETFQMPLHGVAYGSPWQVESRSESKATLTLASSVASRVCYPFDFQLTANYKLKETRLDLRLTIEASTKNENPMPVAAGFHPYFATGPVGSRWQLQTEAASIIQVTAAGLGGKSTDRQASAVIELQAPLSKNSILSSLSKSLCTLVDTSTGRKVLLDWRSSAAQNLLQKVVLWSDGTGRFHCVEPWMGLPNAVKNGVGLQRLTPGGVLQFDLCLSTESDR